MLKQLFWKRSFSFALTMLMHRIPSLISRRCAYLEVPPLSISTTPSFLQPLKTDNLAEVVPEWDVNFVSVEKDMLFELILVRNKPN